MVLSPRDLDYFLEVAHLGQLSDAAAKRGVTPAALSKAIRRLEEALGLQLFERSGKGMSLTPFGESFLQRAYRMREEHDDALRHAGEVRAGRAGLLRIGATIAVLDSTVLPALAYLQPHRPGMRAALTVATSDVALELTRRGTLDACVVPTYDALPHGLAQVVLCSDALVPVARDDHATFRHRRLTLERLAQLPWVLPKSPSAARARIEAVFTRAGVKPPDATVEVDFSSALALQLVRTTDLLALIPQSAAQMPAARGLRVIGMPELHLQRTISVFVRQDLHRSPLMNEFMHVLEAIGVNQNPASQARS